ncbi:chloramphenicol phosphotransferase CPT [Kitasatospora sp. NBC_01287]|uniref:chloramphenicol phosphotransferase CPT n=1 Tax=Kitasatospora sp. NBC_01287 TaxID=2903573 RepID=UPI0022512E25|nr:chloramphenicol phosphotransferase CPT [Kitasatospora sp. NBC_01287]MCX4746106.1 chloramphenicol phosphotransferase CPT [Kitasatospora sp. NBC_01287]
MIILNGGSSSGKSGLARCLQAVLPEPWLSFGVDTFVDGLPAALRASEAGIEFAADGGVAVGAVFRELEAAWIAGLVAMVRAGARVIVDEVFLGGAASQARWERAAEGLEVLWVGVRCEAAVAAGREMARGDRVGGMAAAQAELVHRGVRYDLEVDTAHAESVACARLIADHLGRA